MSTHEILEQNLSPKCCAGKDIYACSTVHVSLHWYVLWLYSAKG